MSSQTVAILGATSIIGRDIADVLARNGTDLLLFARDQKQAGTIALELESRHRIRTRAYSLDVLDFDDAVFRAELESASQSLTGVILCVGHLGDNARAFTDPDESSLITDTNFTGAARALDVAADVLARRQHGYIAALSSVAGDYPRRKVFTYGTAKAKLNAYLESLRTRLRPEGIRVITIKLGSVNTRMASARRNHPLVISSREAAERIVGVLGDADGVVYMPRKWKLIIRVMKLLRV
jgi:short-subunit dehydrogenase